MLFYHIHLDQFLNHRNRPDNMQDHDPDPNITTPNWEFKLARKFLKAFNSTAESYEAPTLRSIELKSNPPNVQKRLGDFSRVFEFLGVEGVTPTPIDGSAVNIKSVEGRATSVDIPTTLNVRHESTDSYSSDLSYSTIPSSALEDAEIETFDEFINKAAKEVRWKENIVTGKLAESRGRSTRAPSAADVDPEIIVQLVVDDSEWDSEIAVPTSSICVNTPGFIPSSVPPPKPIIRLERPPQIPRSCVGHSTIQPFFTLTPTQQKAKLLKKLLKKFGDETYSLLKQNPALAITEFALTTDKKGIHVFVDCSNIIIGFYNRLKRSRNMKEKAFTKPPPVSYQSIALILERGRPVARRVLVGSTSRFLYDKEYKPPAYFIEAEKLGYEVNILERVCKPRRTTPMNKKYRTGNGYATSGQSSESEAPLAIARPTMAEQGVDEILQMKLLESLVDTKKPSTIVLASGDAAEAEYSAGFFKNVERALVKGWKVELVAWHDGLSRDYRNKEFLKRWEGKFRIIELDDFCEEILALYSEPLH